MEQIESLLELALNSNLWIFWSKDYEEKSLATSSNWSKRQRRNCKWSRRHNCNWCWKCYCSRNRRCGISDLNLWSDLTLSLTSIHSDLTDWTNIQSDLNIWSGIIWTWIFKFLSSLIHSEFVQITFLMSLVCKYL